MGRPWGYSRCKCAGCSRFVQPKLPDGRCFVCDTLLRMVDNTFIQVQDLLPGMHVISACNHKLTVSECIVHEEQATPLMQLMTESESVLVTLEHRVVTQLQPRQEIPAKDLLPGQMVAVSGGQQRELTMATQVQLSTVVVEVFLSPDEPVETIPRPKTAILTMGQRHRSKSRRAGMHRRRGNGHNQNDDNESMKTWDPFED